MKMPRKNASYRQSIRIFYKFIGELVSEPVKEFAPNGQIPSTVPVLGEFNMQKGHQGNMAEKSPNAIDVHIPTKKHGLPTNCG